MKKNRSTLKDYFKKGAIPTEANFADLIDSMLNQDEDNISKLPNDPLKITAIGVDEALVNFYRVENNAEKLSWQIKQKPDGKPGLNISDSTASRLFIESASGSIGIGTTTPKAKLQVLGGAIMPDAGNTDTAGILFPLDPGGGTGDKAWMRYYPRSGEKMTLEIGVSNDNDDHIALMPSGGVGINTINPVARLDIQQDARTGTTHPTAVKGLYVTGTFSPDSDGVEFRHTNGTEGIGFGHNTIYATGSNANQNLGLKPRGTGKVVVTGPLQVTGGAQVTGALQVSAGQIQMDGAQKIVFADADTSNNLKLQLWGGYGLGINGGTLFYAANGNHSWRDNNGTNERMLLTTGADGGLTVRGTGTSSFAGNVTIGSLQLRGYTGGDVNEWPNFTWYRDTAANWDEGLIKGSSTQGKFGKAGFGIHMHQTRQFSLFSSGWDSLFAVEGASGNTFIKGYVSAKQVYFSAYVESNSRTGPLNPLPMQVTSQNVGSGFSTSTSKFTAPVRGIYLFTMTAFRADETTDPLHWYLWVNSNYANPGGTSADESSERGLMTMKGVSSHASRTVILNLNLGDTVYIQQVGSPAGRVDNFRSGLEGVLLSAIF